VKLLLPKEHGAYAQLGAPLLAALLARPPRPAGLALAVAAVAALVAHESWLVAQGLRGARALRDDGPVAQRRMFVLSVLFAAGAAHGLFYMPAGARLYVAIPAALAAVMGGFCLARAEHTGAGEAVAAVTLSSASLPVALADGLPPGAAFTIWLVFAAGFLVFTATVRAVTARIRRPADWWAGPLAAALAIGVLAAAGAMARADLVGAPAFAAAAAFSALAVPLALVRPGPRHLRLIGWVLALVSVGAAVALAAGAGAAASWAAR
jgi:hypothetical protein